MSIFDQEGFSENDWEDQEDLLWNEYDWQKFLKKNEQDIARFLALYIKLQFKPNHLDEIALRLGWDKEDWAAGESSSSSAVGLEEADSEPMAPLTIHRHPAYIVTRGIMHHLLKSWEYLLEKNPKMLEPVVVWNFLRTLQTAELNAIIAIHAIDFGDYNLCICHLKNGLSALNNALARVQHLLQKEGVIIPKPFVETTRIALFDLREMWLRVIQECRSFNAGGSS